MRSQTPETDELERVLRLVPDTAERHYGLALVRAFVLEATRERASSYGSRWRPTLRTLWRCAGCGITT